MPVLAVATRQPALRHGQRSHRLPVVTFQHLAEFRQRLLVKSRAAASALVIARQESEAEDDRDKPLDCTGLAERINAAGERSREREERGEALEQWTPIYIPPGKENTVRGRLAARINAATARLRQYEAG